jgi:hypothetical protein
MHIAAYMGAKHIMLCGHDCGTLDQRVTYAGYYADEIDAASYTDWLNEIEPQTIALKARLREVYGCGTYSLNPFVNLGLEGHVYSGRKTP